MVRPLGLVPIVMSGCVRVLTHPRVFHAPARAGEVLERIDALLRRPNVIEVAAGPRSWAIFGDLCRATDARGNEVPEAYIAAIAIENGGTLVTADRGFGRFPELDWRHPLD